MFVTGIDTYTGYVYCVREYTCMLISGVLHVCMFIESDRETINVAHLINGYTGIVQWNLQSTAT